MGMATQVVSRVNPNPMGQPPGEKPIGRVLVADEDYSVRRALHNTLFEAGFGDITEASGVEEAISAGTGGPL